MRTRTDARRTVLPGLAGLADVSHRVPTVARRYPPTHRDDDDDVALQQKRTVA